MAEQPGKNYRRKPEEYHIISRGTDLFCLRQGAGPAIVMVHGGCTNSDFYRETAAVLADRFTVVLYDRCGSGRSAEPADEDWSIRAQAEDLEAVIRNTGAPVFLTAHSAGAAIAEQLITSHPELVRAALLHEPVAGTLIPGDDPATADIAAARERIEAGKSGQAIRYFAPLIGPEEEQENRRAMSKEEASRILRDTTNFMKHEFIQTFSWEPDYGKLAVIPLAVGVGELSYGTHRWTTARLLAERLDCTLSYFPGGHKCAYNHPREFADLTAGILEDLTAEAE